jgi:predicted acetyltransferase
VYVERITRLDMEKLRVLLETIDEKKAVSDCINEASMNPDSSNMAFVAKIDEEVIGAFVLAKDVNLNYYKSHFHIQDAILLSEHERKAHSRLIHAVINPIFVKSTRFMLKELLRLSANTCLYFEIHDTTVIPTIFNELIHVRLRRFPHFLDKKWDHERYN